MATQELLDAMAAAMREARAARLEEEARAAEMKTDARAANQKADEAARRIAELTTRVYRRRGVLIQ